MRKKPLLSYEQVSHLLDYCPETGALTYRGRSRAEFKSEAAFKAFCTRCQGKRALSSVNDRGYLYGSLLGTHVLAHRAAWLLHHGHWPSEQIDHINGDRTDNRISNLRDVPLWENLRNRKVQTNNTSGVNGVCFLPKTGKWLAQIRIGGRLISLGQHDSLPAAAAAREAANEKYGFTIRAA